MIPVIIGFASGLLVIMLIAFLRKLDKPVIYGLILAGIGFLYVGFTWSDTEDVIINSIQALFFLFFAYYGIIKGLYILAIGYFLHGIWDLVYDLFPGPDLRPPHYDLFCLSIDFTIGFYLLGIGYRKTKSKVM